MAAKVLIALLGASLVLASAAGAAPTGSISGTVTAAATHGPIAGVPVCAVYERLGEEGEERYCEPTGAAGEYEIEGLPSHEYTIEFLPGTAGLDYIFQAWKNESIWVAGDPVAVGGAAVSGIDAELDEGGELTGQVTNALTGTPVAGVEVCAEPTTFEVEEGCALTGPGGQYTVYGLGADEYWVSFSAPENLELLWQYWNAEPGILEADPVSVAVGGVTGGIDARMVPGARITGRVTDAQTGAPIEGATACVERLDESAYVGRCGTSEADGRYTIRFVPAGTYGIRFYSSNEVNSGGWYRAGACRGDPVAVVAVAGRETSGIDVRLPRRSEALECPVEAEPSPPPPALLTIRRAWARADGKLAVALTLLEGGRLDFEAHARLRPNGRQVTLLRKRVRVNAGSQVVLLTPNQRGRKALKARASCRLGWKSSFTRAARQAPRFGGGSSSRLRADARFSAWPRFSTTRSPPSCCCSRSSCSRSSTRATRSWSGTRRRTRGRA
jgi:hypothetical protein